MDSILLLEDGTSFAGTSFGAAQDVVGEVVFNTSITGYQEIITDPSYRGQIVTFTASQIGNTGINELDAESDRPHLAGIIVREASPRASSWRATSDLQTYLRDHHIPALTNVDTRALTRHLRSRGVMNGIIASANTPRDELQRRLDETPSMQNLDLAREVSCTTV